MQISVVTMKGKWREQTHPDAQLERKLTDSLCSEYNQVMLFVDFA